jgi:hypothetical protein
MPLDLPPDLTGTWALEVVIGTVSKAPIIGETHSTSKTRMLVTVTADAAAALPAWTQSQTVCRTWMEGGSKLAKAVLPPAWVDVMQPRSYPLTLTAEGDGWAYAADTGLQTIGYDEARGALPTRGTDANVLDADKDGRPGATVIIEVPGFGKGEVYIAQRGHSRLAGRVVGPDRVEGSVVIVEMAQATLGASHRVFDFTPDTRPDMKRSTFAMWRVDGASGCAGL